MQTFLPYPDFRRSAACLDRLRLGKQRLEAKQILMILLSETDSPAWRHHPAVLMWTGYTSALAAYGRAVCAEWKRRGYRDSLLQYFRDRSPSIPDLDNIPALLLPPWFGDTAFHKSHQSNLVAKFPEHYGPKFPDTPPGLPYIWPTATIHQLPEPKRAMRTI